MSYFYVILACLPILTSGQFDMQAVAANIFAKIDANNDGNIERPELSVYFAGFDTNHDGLVSRHEYSVKVTDTYGHDPQLNHLLHGVFDVLDVNSDHHLDDTDHDKNFASEDTDGNHLVSLAEYTRFFIATTSGVIAG